MAAWTKERRFRFARDRSCHQRRLSSSPGECIPLSMYLYVYVYVHAYVKISTRHTHTDREQHPQQRHAHAHDKNNTPNNQMKTSHNKHFTTLVSIFPYMYMYTGGVDEGATVSFLKRSKLPSEEIVIITR